MSVAEEGKELADALGWPGAVPGAEVRLHALGTEFEWTPAVADSRGLARFPDLVRGHYRVAGFRITREEERDRVDGRRRMFAGGRKVRFPGADEVTLPIRPDRRGSVVISEIYGPSPFVSEIQYENHHFLELYNNSETTVYLDGMVLGRAFGRHRDVSFSPCESTAPFRVESRGVWSTVAHRFPGSGHEHSLPPGATAVVARDAADHSTVDPAFPDLSGAEFELIGPADADNPDAANLETVVVDTGRSPRGAGMTLWWGSTYFLAHPLEVEALDRKHHRFTWQGEKFDVEYALFPREALLDVVSAGEDDALQDQRSPDCGSWVHADFDALEGGFARHGVDLVFSVQRRALRREDGRVVLQDTNTSAVDFVKLPYSSGQLPAETAAAAGW